MSAPPAATTPAAAANKNTTGVRLRREDEDEDADAHVPDQFRCCICWDAPAGNVQQCRNGHLFCGSGDGEEGGCLDKLRTSAQGEEPPCPVCRTALPEESNRNLAVEQTIALLPATCRHCTLATTWGALGLHEETCPSAPVVACAAHKEGCAWTGRESARGAHEAECALALQRARSDVERGVFAKVLDALLETTTTAAAAQQGKNKALRLVVEHGNLVSLAERLIAGGADVNSAARNEVDGFFPLHIACEHGNLGMVEHLLAAGSRVSAAALSDKGTTPLHLACFLGPKEIVTRLLAAGAEVNHCRLDGVTPLYLASQEGLVDVVELLVAAGADADKARTGNGTTPLMVAVLFEHVLVVDRLIAAGADVNARADDGYTAFVFALNADDDEIVQKLRSAGATEEEEDSEEEEEG
jgi:ankyrin repeat protein